MEIFLQYERNQRNLNSCENSKGGTFVVELILKYPLPTLLRFRKNTKIDFFDLIFEKLKFDVCFFLQNVGFHRSKPHL